MPIDRVCSVQNIWWPLSALSINCRAPTGGLCVGIFIRFLKRQQLLAWSVQLSEIYWLHNLSFPKTNSKFLIAQCILFSSSYIQPHLLVCMCHRKGFTSLQVSFVSPIVVNWWTFSSRKGETWFLGSEPVTADFRAVTIMWNKFFEIFRVHILKAECTTLKKERDCLITAY